MAEEQGLRRLTSHVVNEANDRLVIEVVDRPGPGGAPHRYEITGFDTKTNPSSWDPLGYQVSYSRVIMLFQNGGIAEAGVNGITHEVLIAILIDRLECFQKGPYASQYNLKALWHLNCAQMTLKQRTLDRMEQGIEGTMQVGTESMGDPAKWAATPDQKDGRDHGESGAPLAGPQGDPVHKGKPPTGNPIMKFFAHSHLPEGPLRETSAYFTDAARWMDANVPDGAEKSAGLRKLLEAKDCFVRACLPK